MGIIWLTVHMLKLYLLNLGCPLLLMYIELLNPDSP